MTSPGQELVHAWRKLDRNSSCLILPGDEAILPYGDSISSEQFARSERLIAPSERFLFNLVPSPFGGKILTAKVYILMLNPGFGLLDIFAEEQSPEFRSALFQTLGGKRAHLGFDHRFYWTGGFGYNLQKFRGLLERIQKERDLTDLQSLQFFANHVATLELVPYHSTRFALPRRIVDQLESVRLMKAFVLEELIHRAKRGDCTLIATRRADDWDLGDESENIVIYRGSESRAAHLSPDSRGGQTILKQLRKIS